MNTTNFVFNSQVSLGPTLPVHSFQNTEFIKNEPMLFSCDKMSAYSFGGVLTHIFLDQLNSEFYNSPNLIIDSRVHMLMPGWYPCIPGWHHDAVERTRKDGQPNYTNPSCRTKHCLALVSDNGVCPTEFALGQSEFPDVPLNEIYYKIWHPMVEDKCKNGELLKIDAPFNKMVYFDDRTWHQGTKSLKNGWRWFIRASIDPSRKPTNEVRQQVQVYLENPMEGW